MKRMRHIHDPEIPCMIAAGLLGDLRAYAILGRDDKVDEIYASLERLHASTPGMAVTSLLEEAAQCREGMKTVIQMAKRWRTPNPSLAVV